MNYKNQQYARQEALIKERALFDGVTGGGRFMGKPRTFVLQDPEANLYAPIREYVKAYFAENGIDWWRGNGPSGHTL